MNFKYQTLFKAPQYGACGFAELRGHNLNSIMLIKHELTGNLALAFNACGAPWVLIQAEGSKRKEDGFYHEERPGLCPLRHYKLVLNHIEPCLEAQVRIIKAVNAPSEAEEKEALINMPFFKPHLVRTYFTVNPCIGVRPSTKSVVLITPVLTVESSSLLRERVERIAFFGLVAQVAVTFKLKFMDTTLTFKA